MNQPTTSLQLSSAAFSTQHPSAVAHLDPVGNTAPPDFISPSALPWLADAPLNRLNRAGLYVAFGKRLLDIGAAFLVTLFVLSWLIPLIGVLIIWESPGPVFFVQSRSGRRARSFPCLKFRTMYHRPQTGFEQTRQQDRRVTVLGAFLRRTNLDEMPQFINVLLGHMSLVGPRPHARQHDAQHWDSSAYRQRYWVKPGITGLAQVRGNRGETQRSFMMDHRIRYDHFYIRRFSLLLDLKICLATLRLTLKGDQNAW